MATTQTTTTRALTAPTAATTSSPPAASPTPRIRPYKDFLTPALHRRFAHAAYLILAACYFTSVILAPPSLLWFWNPLSTTTLRTIALFVPCLCVFIVRVANLRCGEIHAKSQAEWVLSIVTGVTGWHTLFWYLVSSFVFGEVYIASQAGGVGLEWVDKGREYERARANENPVFLRAFFMCLALAQTALHLARGEDKVPIPEDDKDPIAAQQKEQETGTSYLPTGMFALYDKAGTIAQRVLKLAFPAFAFTLPTYFLLLRRYLWPFFYSVARTFHRSLPPASPPTGLQHIPTLTWQSLTSSLMLLTLWETSNAAFTIYVSRPPLAKSGIDPLTSGAGSKDPNGSLLSGLKSKKDVPRTFAFWELSLICEFFPTRRKTIYTEPDRSPSSTWTQISQLCIEEIAAIQTRISDFQIASTPPKEPDPTPSDLMPPEKKEPLGLPRIADRGVVSNAAVTTQPPRSLERSVGAAAKAIGQSPQAQNPLSPRARKAIEWTSSRGLNRANLDKEASSYLSWVLRTPVGEPLRQTFAARVQSVVLGSPVGRARAIVFASRALSGLCVTSLREDDFGQVAKSIASIIRTYVDAITAIESFVRGLQPHWSDVDFRESDRSVQEVQKTVRCLREGLESVVLSFGEYAGAVGVSKKELREARECVAAGRERGEGV